MGGGCGVLPGSCTVSRMRALVNQRRSRMLQGWPGLLQVESSWGPGRRDLHRLPPRPAAGSQDAEVPGRLQGCSRPPASPCRSAHGGLRSIGACRPTRGCAPTLPVSLQAHASARQRPRPFCAPPSLSPRAHGVWGCGSTSRATRLESALGLGRLECAELGRRPERRAAFPEQRLPAHASTGRGGCDRGSTAA